MEDVMRRENIMRSGLALRFASGLASAMLVLGGAPAAASEPAPTDKPPHLIVVISIDQYSGDLFSEYRGEYSAGLKRLQSGVVFPRAYQGHAITETCPGHSTILTGSRPSRTGIVANMWYDPAVPRADKTVYCMEDPGAEGSDSSNYRASSLHLKVPTFGDRLKAAVPGTRVVSVAGKDRAAILLGGHAADESWWWNGHGFGSYAGREPGAAVLRLNQRIEQALSKPAPPLAVPKQCAVRAQSLPLDEGLVVGEGRFEREAGDAKGFRGSPALDQATLQLAGDFAEQMALGRGEAVDILTIGLSASDVVGHRYGTGGQEMCIQQLALDAALGGFLERLDRTGVDYMVVLTADHGGHDLPERGVRHAQPTERRASALLSPQGASGAVASRTGIDGDLLWSEGASGDIYVSGRLAGAERARVIDAAFDHYSAQPEVAAVFRRDELAAAPPPKGPPDEWSLLDRARAGFHPGRSGDLLVLLKPNVMSVVVPRKDLAAMHGSPWDMDRRVPLLFWRKGITPFEQPLPVETVDILPTLAALVGLHIPEGEIDGRCLDIAAGPRDSCG
jgi:predicted AlkP superfamily pyrophosphatase or phosphodiesterase